MLSVSHCSLLMLGVALASGCQSSVEGGQRPKDGGASVLDFGDGRAPIGDAPGGHAEAGVDARPADSGSADSGSAVSGPADSGPAVSRPVVSGVLKRSDTPLSPRFYRADWYETFSSFHSNRVVWTYAGPALIPEATQRGIAVQCTVPYWVPQDHPQKERMVCIDPQGNYAGPPSDALQGASPNRRPDFNSEEWRAYLLAELKTLVDQGCTSFQQDGPAGNALLVAYGGCYSDGSVVAFRDYLRPRYSAAELAALGVGAVDTFNYRTQNLPALQSVFAQFQKEATAQYHRWLHDAVRAYARSRSPALVLPFSANLTIGQLRGGASSWLAPYFDFLISEVHGDRDSTPDALRLMRAEMGMVPGVGAVTLARADGWLHQRTIASAYALGLAALAPWDVYVSAGAPRFFGEPADFAPLFALVRSNPLIFDDYDSESDHYGSYDAALPSQGYVESVDVASYPERTTVLWSRRSAFAELRQGQKLYVGNAQQTITVDTHVGSIYLPAGVSVAPGDPVFLSEGRGRYLVTVRRHLREPQKKAVHLVSWLEPTVATDLHLRRSDFPVPPRTIITALDPEPRVIAPRELGSYYIYSLGNVAWAILSP